MKIYIPPQVTRLTLFLVVFIALFIVVKRLLTPDDFGKYGHYRPGALADNAAHEPKFVGDETCIMCHEDLSDQKSSDLHSDISCEACHKAGASHVETMESTDIHVPSGREFCGLCHSENAARKMENVLQVKLEEHNSENNCTDCHNPHAPWDLK